MAVLAKVRFHLHPNPSHSSSSSPKSSVFLNAPNPLSHFHSRPILISNRRFLLPPWPLHHIPTARQYWDSKFDEGEDFDDGKQQWEDALDDFIDSMWIFKVFRSYGVMLPFILLAMLLANGLKAFVIALALPIGQSTFAFAIRRFQNRDEIKIKPKTKTQRSRADSPRSYTSSSEEDEGVEWIRKQRPRKKKKGYKSRNDVSVSNTEFKTKGRSKYGGWDELDIAGMESSVGSSTMEDQETSGSEGTRG